MPHALTIDLEDWHQLIHQSVTGEQLPPTPELVHATSHLLDQLDEIGVKATFFVVGKVVEVYPQLVRELACRGHEVGSHTYTHTLLGKSDRVSFLQEMRRAIAQIEDLTGARPVGFRAPEFSVQRLDHWCFEVLGELGFEYDSSVFPIARLRYGIADAPTHPFRLSAAAGGLLEFPLATWDAYGTRWPVAGGTYFRLLPLSLLEAALRDLTAQRRTAVLYFHPYEFYTSKLRLTSISLRTKLTSARYLKYRFLHNLQTPLILSRLRQLLLRFDFQTLAAISNTLNAANATKSLVTA
jgi:polysaccharide deacetylase family protein (PEP-CTERM system associated)